MGHPEVGWHGLDLRLALALHSGRAALLDLATGLSASKPIARRGVGAKEGEGDNSERSDRFPYLCCTKFPEILPLQKLEAPWHH